MLFHHTLKELVDSKPDDMQGLVSIVSTETVEKAISLMRHHNITSLPVTDEAVAGGTEFFCGVVHLVDVMVKLLSNPVWELLAKEEANNPNLTAQRKIDFLKQHAEKMIALFEEPISTYIGAASSEEIWSLSAESTLEQALEVFSRGVSRLLVQDSAFAETTSTGGAAVKLKTSLLTQIDVIHFLHNNTDTLAGFVRLPLWKVGLANPPPSVEAENFGADPPGLRPVFCQELQTVTPATSALQALKDIHGWKNWHDHAVPIVDEQGKLLGTLSASDLRGLTRESWPYLVLPVLEFLKVMNSDSPVDVDRERMQIEVTATHNIAYLLSTVARSGVHRIWLVDQKEKLLGVINLSNILSRFAPNKHQQTTGTS